MSRVWLHTNNFDHSSALPNYLKRGFTIVEEEPPGSGGVGDDVEELVMRLA